MPKFLKNHKILIVVGIIGIILGVVLSTALRRLLIILGVLSTGIGLAKTYSEKAQEASKKKEKAELDALDAQFKAESLAQMHRDKEHYKEILEKAKSAVKDINTPEKAAEDANKILEASDEGNDSSDQSSI